MIKKINENLIIISGILILILLGWFGNDVYRNWSNQREFDGLYMKNINYLGALNRATELDKFGNWVCVNIRGMSIKKAVEVCKHEVGHEIFAMSCEKNITKCLGIIEDGNK